MHFPVLFLKASSHVEGEFPTDIKQLSFGVLLI